MLYIGIDPGKKGAMALLGADGSFRDLVPLPLHEGAHDPRAIGDQLLSWTRLDGPLHATVERLQVLPRDRNATPEEIRQQLQRTGRSTGRTPLGGIKANFERGCSTCGFEWFLYCFQLFRINTTFQLVPPRTWQAAMFVERLATPKASSIRSAERLFPGVSLKPPRGRVKNHNFADALLLAAYGLRGGSR